MRCILNIVISCALATLMCSYKPNEVKTIWQIGTADGSADEFALAGGDYEKFLDHDFGWEDRFYVVGKSNPKQEFPYILPGPADAWGGTSPTAGIRTHVLNILFRMKSAPQEGGWKLMLMCWIPIRNVRLILR